MRKTIIQSIAAIVAAGVWPELWHPRQGLMKVVGMGSVYGVDYVSCRKNSGGRTIRWDNPTGFLIPRKPFADLVERVKADPVDNPASDMIRPGLLDLVPHSEAVMIGELGQSIRIGAKGNKRHYYTLQNDWAIVPESSHFVVRPKYFLSLLAAGYPVGLDPDHVIFEEEIK